MFSVGPSEMLVLMVVALLLYGGDLPKVARSWGKSLGEFKKGLSGIQNELNSVLYDDPPRRIPYHDPVYSHNAGTVDGELIKDTPSHSPEASELAGEPNEPATSAADDSRPSES